MGRYLTIEREANRFAANWTEQRDWSWYDRPENPHLWGFYTLEHRDADLLTKSNSKAIKKTLEDFEEDQVIIGSFGHWAVGWVESLIIKVYRFTEHTARIYEDNDYGDSECVNLAVTPAFQLFFDDVLEPMSDYGVLDEDDYYEMESEEKNRAYEEAWSDAIDHIENYDADKPFSDEVKWRIWYWLDGGDTNPVTGKTEYTEVEGSSAWVDYDKILDLLEYLKLIEKNDDDEWVLPYREPIDLAMEAAKEFQMGFALGGIEYHEQVW